MRAGGADRDEAGVKSHLTKLLHITVNDQKFGFPSINYKNPPVWDEIREWLQTTQPVAVGV